MRAYKRASYRRKAEKDPGYRELLKLRARERYKTPESIRSRREQKLRTTYGLTSDDVARMLTAQGGLCAICASMLEPDKTHGLHIDHDHETKQIRELLCPGCNVGLGHFREDPQRLRAAADYIEKHRRALKSA